LKSPPAMKAAQRLGERDPEGNRSIWRFIV